ncbi:MAG: hypothetical protein SFT92_01905 [Rickettsiales bacterium]|nr:hypothetical protein [Rickettsiales bacterium]
MLSFPEHNNRYRLTVLPAAQQLVDGRFSDDTAELAPIVRAIDAFLQQPNLSTDQKDIIKQALWRTFQKSARTVYIDDMENIAGIDEANVLEIVVTLYTMAQDPAFSNEQLHDIVYSKHDYLNRLNDALPELLHAVLLTRQMLLNLPFMQPYLERTKHVVAEWALDPDTLLLMSYRQPIFEPNFVISQADLPDSKTVVEFYRRIKDSWPLIQSRWLMPQLAMEPKTLEDYTQLIQHFKDYHKVGATAADQMALLAYNVKYNANSPLYWLNMDTAIEIYDLIPAEIRDGLTFYDFFEGLKKMTNLASITHASEYNDYPRFQDYMKKRFFPELLATAREAGVNPLYFLLEMNISSGNTYNKGQYNKDVQQGDVQLISALFFRAGEKIAPELPLRDIVHYLLNAQNNGTWLERVIARIRAHIFSSDLMYGNHNVPVYDLVRTELLTYGLKDMESEVYAKGILLQKDWFEPQMIAAADKLMSLSEQADQQRALVRQYVKQYIADYGSTLDIFLDLPSFGVAREYAWDIIGYDGTKFEFRNFYQYNLFWRQLNFCCRNYTPDVPDIQKAYERARQYTVGDMAYIFSVNPNHAREYFLANELFHAEFFEQFAQGSFADSLQEQVKSPALRESIRELFPTDREEGRIVLLQTIKGAMDQFVALKEQAYQANMSLYARLNEHHGEQNLKLQLRMAVSSFKAVYKYIERAFEARAASMGLPAPDAKALSTEKLYTLGVIVNREIAAMENMVFASNYPRIAQGLDLPYNYEETTMHLLNLWQKMIELGVLPTEDAYNFDVFFGLVRAMDPNNPGYLKLITPDQYEQLQLIYYRINPKHYSTFQRVVESIYLIWRPKELMPLIKARLPEVAAEHKKLDEQQQTAPLITDDVSAGTQP